jgi:hypothetical protein
MRGTIAAGVVALGIAVGGPPVLAAQETAADTAAVLLSAAEALDRDGKHDVAEELLRYILRRYPDTASAAEARRLLTGVRRAQQLGAGRTGFIVWNTVFSAWLGVAVPAAFGADEPAPYGAGLLIGAPAGFLGSGAYARRYPLTLGQGALYQLSTLWLSWQALGWREVFGIGDVCVQDQFGEYCDTPDTAPWAALALGGLAGIGTGLALTRLDVDDGTAALVRHAAFWGTWYGFAAGVLTGAEDDGLLPWTLLGGDVAIGAGVPVAKLWRPSPGQVRLVTAAGLAGGLMGGGLDLLLEVDDEKTAVAIPLVGTTVGIVAGMVLVSGGGRAAGERNANVRSALLNVDRGASIGLPTPLPTAIPALARDGHIRRRPGASIVILHASF